MFKYLLLAIVILQNMLFAQPTVFNKVSYQMQFPNNAVRMGNHYLIGNNQGDKFSLTEIDSTGNIVNNSNYGTPGWDLPNITRKQTNNEIFMMGHTFWDGVANIGNYKGYVVITDSIGIFKKSFVVKSNTTIFNRVLNGIFLDGYYYFVGEDIENNFIPTPLLFLCKTDTVGNILWYKKFPQLGIKVGTRVGLEYTYDQTNFLVGVGHEDSVVGNYYYYSYFLMRIDTSGNFINRIPVPEFASNIHYTGVQYINQISKMFNNKYLVCGHREYYLLDSQYSILDSFDLVQYLYDGYFAHQNLYDSSYIVGGYQAFGKIYKGVEQFGKDFANEPDIIFVKDVIPTYDGGYLAIILCTGGVTRYIKMDCDGNYVNPIYCWVTGTNELTKIDLQMNFYNNRYSFNNKSEFKLEAKLFDLQGRALQQFAIEKGISNMGIGNYAKGIYVIAITHDGMVVKTENILLE